MASTPVSLVTGFLGSGKTTLISRLLAHPDMGETAVIVNELGEVAIDHHLLRRVDERTVLLRSGCVCCTLRGDLADELRDLLGRRERGEIPPFRRVVVETTGLADPAPIVYTLLSEPVVRHHYKLETVVATIDAVNGLRHEESLKQAAIADTLVVTKGDLAETTGRGRPGGAAESRRRRSSRRPSATWSPRGCSGVLRATRATSRRPVTSTRTASAPCACSSRTSSTGWPSASG